MIANGLLLQASRLNGVVLYVAHILKTVALCENGENCHGLLDGALSGWVELSILHLVQLRLFVCFFVVEVA